MPQNRRALDTVGRKPFQCEWQIGSPTLETHLSVPLAHGDLRDLVHVQAELPIGAEFSGRVIGFILQGRLLADPEKAGGGILEERRPKTDGIPAITEGRIDIGKQQFPLDLLAERADKPKLPPSRLILEDVQRP